MVQNLTDIAATNVTTSTPTSQFFDQNLAAIIALIALLLALIGILYKFGQQVGEIKGIKEVVNANLESLNQKYNTTEKLQKMDLNLENMMKSHNDLENRIKRLRRTHAAELRGMQGAAA
jgi:predicted Holliday junction resolvase-like endonuclease